MAQVPLTGPEAIRHALEKIDLDTLEEKARKDLATGASTKRRPAVKVLHVIEGLRKNEISPTNLTISKVPVIPPSFRPFSLAGETFIPGDANELYKDLLNYKKVYSDLRNEVGDEGSRDSANNLYNAVRAVYGYGDAVNPKSKQRGVSGFLQHLIGKGGSPKLSVFQRRLFSKTMDSVGRGVITANPELDMDEIGIPETMAWKLYGPYVQRRLVQTGMSPGGALDHLTERTDFAKKALEREMGQRPVIYSRAPAWHKFNTVAGWAKLVDGDNIATNPWVSTGMNADHDGDTVNIHLPSQDDAVQEAKDILMPSKMVFSIKDENKVVPSLKHEQVLGLYTSKHRPAQHKHVFHTEDDATQAIQSGQVSLSDEIEIIGQTKMAHVDDFQETLEELKAAKAASDVGMYHKKHRILRRLIESHQNEFVIDSREGPILGIKHTPTGFRLHTKATSVPPSFLMSVELPEAEEEEILQ
jgi:DNA-directed RNA polymerase subunit beta'